ncbi:MAG: DEAD/DEAH box helicase, partial [Gemmatimonadota bacterium]
MAWPRIVAEALRRVSRPAEVSVARATPASLHATLAAIRAEQAPRRSARIPPTFLHSHQHDAWRRIVAALDGWGGALLLDPVGSGKTWIALGAATCERGPVVAVVPAILRAQWTEAARRARISLTTFTHERASRGALPTVDATFVIIDEAHRFRDPATRRTRTLAPWLAGRRTLLLTATPILNSLSDLVTLLRIATPEDALALDGISRLGDLEQFVVPPDALRRIAIRSGRSTVHATDRRVTTLDADPDETERGSDAVAAIGTLTLSDRTATHRLIRSVLLDAAASSDAALHQALKRYRALLLQARDAGGASRAMLRRFAGESLEQTVLWPLLQGTAADGDLPIDDLDGLERLLAAPTRDEPWIRSLAGRCDDDRPTICFTRHRATARLLRTALGDDTAWITGVDAGIGPHRIPREAILSAFGPQRPSWQVRRNLPQVLVATDVAAEGLDLHAAGRIVHVDLPWTATRVEQREGRLLRLGQHYPEVEVIVRLPAPAIEAALEPRARIMRKQTLAEEWLHALERIDPVGDLHYSGPFVSFLADDREDADLVAVRLQCGDRVGVVLAVRERDGPWMLDGGRAELLVDRAQRLVSIGAPAGAVTDIVTAAMRAAMAATWIGASPAAVMGRIHRLARRAAARRDGETLQHLDRLLRFASAPQTLGGRAIIATLLDLSDRDFVRLHVPDPGIRGPVRATAIAAVCLRSGFPSPAP